MLMILSKFCLFYKLQEFCIWKAQLYWYVNLFFASASLGSFVIKILDLTIMAKTPHSGSISYFFQNLDLIYSLMVQAATILYLLAKIASVTHQSFYVCLDG